MKTKQKKIIKWSVIILVIGTFFTNVCEISSLLCTQFLMDVGQMLAIFSLVSFILSVIIYFLREEIFLSWWKFVKYYLPIAFFLILGFSSGGGGSFSMGNDMEAMVFFTAGLYFIISLVLIAVKSWKLRGK